MAQEAGGRATAPRRLGSATSWLASVTVLAIVAAACTPFPQPNTPSPPRVQYIQGPLRAVNGKLVDATQQEVRLTGVNWWGGETETYAPHGLWARNWQEMLDQMVAAGFNTVRFPFSDQMLEPNRMPNGIDYWKNPDLKGLNSLALLDRLIDGAGKRGLKVILDRHRVTGDKINGLWYGDIDFNRPDWDKDPEWQQKESTWINNWVMLAKHYRGNKTIIGADLDNEPSRGAQWGGGVLQTDWRLAAERAGNAILAVNPDWLIIVEGVANVGGDWYWQGGNLAAAKQYPVRLSRPEKLVYSAHDYGPGVWPQWWLQSSNFPADLTKVWESHWAYLQLEGIAPILMGEFGGRSVGRDVEGTWQRSLVAYMRQHGVSYTYWGWNPNSTDTGGVLLDDWRTIDSAKMRILSAYQWPRLIDRSASTGQVSGARDIVAAYHWPGGQTEIPLPAGVLPPVAVSSPDLRLTQNIFPRDFTCDTHNGQPRVPTFQWGPAPARTASVVVDFRDVDTGTAPGDDLFKTRFRQWVVYNLPPSTTSIPPVPSGAHEGFNDFGQAGYSAPCPPRGHGHRYVFQVFFLDSNAQLGPQATRDQIIEVERGKHVIATGTLNVAYDRPEEP